MSKENTRKQKAAAGKPGGKTGSNPMGRIAVLAVCLLVMIPAALSYAGGGLLSGFPSSATVGDSVTWTVDPGDEEGDLQVSASGASVSKNGYSFTVTFNQAGTATINASVGSTSDSCSVTVSEKEEPSSDDPETDDPETDDPESDDPESDDPGTDDPGKDEPGKDDPSGNDKPGAKQDENKGKMPGGNGSMPSGGMKMPSGSGSMPGSFDSGSFSSGDSSSDSKTTYTGSADNYLESLSVKGHDFTQKFNKTNDTYFLTVDSDVDSVTVKAEPTDDDAEVVITGNDDLSIGRNKVMVSVTAENGAVRVYRIYIDVK